MDETTFGRRRALLLFGGAGAAVLVGCGSDDASSSATTGGSTGGATTGCTEIPAETGGPFPADGSNGPNVLTEDGVVRSDITSSFGSLSGTADGVPLAINLTILDADGCAARAGAAVYLWHCDQAGRYSLYSQGATDQNYLRGVQEADDSGRVTFESIFPAAYSGRWPHIHFAVFDSLEAATGGGSPIATSQLALPQGVCATVYETEGYESSVRNLSQTSLDSDMVFGDDGAVRQLATTSGSVDAGYTADLAVPV